MILSELPPAPERLIRSDGAVNFGNFAGAVDEVNFEDFDFTRLKRRPWTLSAKTAQWLFKRWQFVGVIDEDFVFGAAVAHVQYLGNGFAYLYDRHSGKLVEQKIKKPLAQATQFSRSPIRGTTQMGKPGNLIRMDNQAGEKDRGVTIDCGSALRAEITYREPGAGVSTACRQAMYGFHYTYKSAGLPARGKIQVGDRQYELSDKALALLDWTSSTPLHETIWNWAAGVGFDAQGRPMGINFSLGLVVSGYTQNVVWQDGKPHVLGGVNFDYDQANILGHPWRLSTVDDACDLTFRPAQERYENINLGLVASSLHQPFGAFEGTLRLGETGIAANLFGFCEEHYAKW